MDSWNGKDTGTIKSRKKQLWVPKKIPQGQRPEHLKRMYQCYCNIPGALNPIISIFKQQVIDDGLALVKRAEDAARNKIKNKECALLQEWGPDFIEQVTELHDKHMDHVQCIFGSSKQFYKALKEAYEVFCNKMIADMSPAQLLASYCDFLLRKRGGYEKLNEVDVEGRFDKVVCLLGYIHEKDLFAEFYRKKLAIRLLGDRATNDDHEKLILVMLRQQFGCYLMSKMEKMFENMMLAKKNRANFHTYLDSIDPSKRPDLDFFVTVLARNLWPAYEHTELNIPREMIKCLEFFKEHYKEDKRKKLTWIHSLGSCDMVGHFTSGSIELNVTTAQAAVLMLFNASERMTCSEIVKELNLGHEEVVRLLHSLSCSKYKILKKEPDNSSFSKNDLFVFNFEFTNIKRCIRIPPPPLVEEKKKVKDDTHWGRDHVVDAALVRIMKNRKVLEYKQLTTECTQLISNLFKPDDELLEKRVEDLIKRNYLKRNESNPSKIWYNP